MTLYYHYSLKSCITSWSMLLNWWNILGPSLPPLLRLAGMALLSSRLLRHSVCRNGVRQSPQSAALFTFILSLALHHTADPSRHSHEANVPEVNTFRINWWSCYLLGIVDVIWTMNFPVRPWNVHLLDTCSALWWCLLWAVTWHNAMERMKVNMDCTGNDAVMRPRVHVFSKPWLSSLHAA